MLRKRLEERRASVAYPRPVVGELCVWTYDVSALAVNGDAVRVEACIGFDRLILRLPQIEVNAGGVRTAGRWVVSNPCAAAI